MQHGETGAPLQEIDIKAGQTVDFITDMKQNHSHDSFEWKIVVKFTPTSAEREIADDAADQFQGPQPPPIEPWAQLAQILLLSNEFQFID